MSGTNFFSGHRVVGLSLVVGVALMTLCCGVVWGGESDGPATTEGEDEVSEMEETAEMPTGKEAVREVEEAARERISEAVAAWRRALESLTARKSTGWILCAALVLAGGALLFFGWRLINSTFVFLSSAVGAGTGAYMALQACVVTNPHGDPTGKATCVVLGAVFGITLYLGTALRARPVAWMLVVAAPFLALSASVFPSSPPLAVVAAAGGLGMGLATAFRQRSIATVSSAMLGAMILIFSAGMLVYLVDTETVHGWFDAAVGRPLVLALGMVLLIFIGTDLQLVLSRGEEQ